MDMIEYDPVLDMFASKEEQLKVLINYLEMAAQDESNISLRITGRSLAFMSRMSFDGKQYVDTKESSISEETAFLYYLQLKKEENGKET